MLGRAELAVSLSLCDCHARSKNFGELPLHVPRGAVATDCGGSALRSESKNGEGEKFHLLAGHSFNFFLP